MSIEKVNFYATSTTLSRYIPLCAITYLYRLKKLLSVNNPGKPNVRIGKNYNEVPEAAQNTLKLLCEQMEINMIMYTLMLKPHLQQGFQIGPSLSTSEIISLL